MRSPWALLAAAPFFFALLRTIATEPQNNTSVEDDGRREFEDNVLRAWVEQLIEKYYENEQSSTRSTNIQRIAKKGRTSGGPAGTRGRVAPPPPVDSVLFNPYYRPSFYSGYVPFPYGPPTTTHLIPIGHMSYPQQGYHRRLFIPVQSQQFPYVPEITSPALVQGGGDYSNFENRPADVQQTQYVVVPNGPEDGGPHDLETVDGDLDQGVEGERPNPTRDGKLLQGSGNDNIPTANPTSTSTTTTTTRTTTITSAPEFDDATTDGTHSGHDESDFTSASPSQTFSSDPQRPSSEDSYRSADESRTRTPRVSSSAATVTEQPSVSPKRLETTTTEPAKETSTSAAETDGGPREAQDHHATPETTTADVSQTTAEATTRTPVETTTVVATSAAYPATSSVSIPSSESVYSTTRSTTDDSPPSSTILDTTTRPSDENDSAKPTGSTAAAPAPTPLIAKDDNERKYTDLKDVSVSTSTEWTTISNPTARHEPLAKIARDDLSPSANTPPTSDVTRLQTNTENGKTYTDDETNVNYRPPPTTTRSTIVPPTRPRYHGDSNDPRIPSYTTISNDSPYGISTTNGRDQYATKTSSQTPPNLKGSDLWYDQLNTKNLAKKELNEEQIDFLLKKLIKLLKPEIEKQSITKESIARFITPKHGDQEKLIYIILPWVRDATQNKGNEEQTASNTDPLKTFNKM